MPNNRPDECIIHFADYVAQFLRKSLSLCFGRDPAYHLVKRAQWRVEIQGGPHQFLGNASFQFLLPIPLGCMILSLSPAISNLRSTWERLRDAGAL